MRMRKERKYKSPQYFLSLLLRLLLTRLEIKDAYVMRKMNDTKREAQQLDEEGDMEKEAKKQRTELPSSNISFFERAVEGASPLNIAPRMGRTSRQTPTTLIYHIESVDSPTTGLRTTYAQNINPKALSTVTIPALPHYRQKAFVGTLVELMSSITNKDRPTPIEAKKCGHRIHAALDPK
ncbi:hypothetical protein Q7P36_000850 [Cladosporium allicinum]